MREGDVPRLLCDVNPHDALHHRVKGALGAQIALLDVVDGLLTAEDAHEEDGRELPGRQPEERCRPAHDRAESGYVGSGPVDQLLEHQGVVALLDHLVGAIAELRGAVREHGDVLHEPADQDLLEQQPDLRDVRLPVHADRDLPFHRLRLVPRMSAERVDVGQDPARIIVDHLELGRVPVDIGVRVEAAVDRPLGESVEHRRVLGVLDLPLLGCGALRRTCRSVSLSRRWSSRYLSPTSIDVLRH